MNDAWLTVVVCGVATIAIKAAGPVLLAGRRLPAPAHRTLALLAPALLAALVVTNAVGSGQRIVLDARLAGLAAAVFLMWRRAPVLLVVVVAAVVTATVRAI